MSGFLDDMVERRARRIASEYGPMSAADREKLACCARAVRDFEAALCEGDEVAIIAEVKKASPSAGLLAPSCDAAKQALHYQRGGAAAISVLTEPEEFGGSFTDLSDVADAVDVPVLCKDFVVDPVQLFVARGHGADAVLLMVSVLGEAIGEYVDLADTLGLAAVVEVTDLRELRTALSAQATVIAVNSRDLRTLEVDTDAAQEVLTEAQRFDVTLVAASGVSSRADVEAAARAGADAVLVGEMLMRSQFPEDAVEGLTGVSRAGRSREDMDANEQPV